MEAQTLSVPQAGRVLGIGRNTSFRLAREGVIPSIRLGKQIRVPIPALKEMLRNPAKQAEKVEVAH